MFDQREGAKRESCTLPAKVASSGAFPLDAVTSVGHISGLLGAMVSDSKLCSRANCPAPPRSQLQPFGADLVDSRCIGYGQNVPAGRLNKLGKS